LVWAQEDPFMFFYFYFLSLLFLTLTFSFLVSTRTCSSGSKKCFHRHPKSVGHSKLLDFGYLLVEFGRRVGRVHLLVHGHFYLKESVVATRGHIPIVAPPAWFPSTCVCAPCRKQRAPLPGCIFGNFQRGTTLVAKQEKQKKEEERKKKKRRR